jgi:uncharacterized membrane protein
MRRFLAGISGKLFLLGMLLGSALITATSLSYFDFERLPAFAIERFPVRFEALWLAALRVHVASALVSFPLCLLLSTRWLQRKTEWHRSLGRIAGVLVLFALVPSGVVLAFEAKGGALVSSGFLVSAAIVAACIVGGVVAARRRDLAAHARAMRHVVGQLSVAVSSRILLVGLDAAGIDPDLAYVVALWVPVLASAALAELASLRSGFFRAALVRFRERVRRETFSHSSVIRVRALARHPARFGR